MLTIHLKAGEPVKYPRLKDSVRIKKYPHAVYVYEQHTQAERWLHPAGALVLTLCQGCLSLPALYDCASTCFGVDRPLMDKDIDSLLQNCADFLEYPEAPLASSIAYDSRDFLFSPTAAPRRLATPVGGMLALTNRCNFTCRYCFNGSAPSRTGELDTETWLDLIDQLRTAGVLNVELTGGEPMLHPGFSRILERLADSGILVTVYTNGSLITPEWIERFASIPDVVAQVSLDTIDEMTHHALTMTKDTLQAVRNAMAGLARAGVHVRCKALMLPQTCANVASLIRYCADVGVRQLMLDTFDLSCEGRGSSDFFLSPAQCDQVQSIVDAQQTKDSRMAVTFHAGVKGWQCEKDIVPCGALQESFCVLAGGAMTLCEKTAGMHDCAVGHFPAESFMTLWQSPRIEEILYPRQAQCHTPCDTCSHFDRCRGGCPAMKQAVRASARQADPRCWQACYPNNPFNRQY